MVRTARSGHRDCDHPPSSLRLRMFEAMAPLLFLVIDILTTFLLVYRLRTFEPM